MKSVKYLDLTMSKYGYKFDKELAEKLGKTTAAISQYKSGSRIMDDETCLALAIALEIDPLEIIGAACIDRAEKTGQKSLFEFFMLRATQTASAALLLVFVTLFLTPSTGEARPAYVKNSDSLYYVKSAIRLLLSKAAKFASSFRTIARSYAR